MTAAERQRRRRTRLAGLDRQADAESDHDRTARQLRAQLTELERENQQLRERLQGSRPAVISPAATPPIARSAPAATPPIARSAPAATPPIARSAPAATPWLNRIVANRKR